MGDGHVLKSWYLVDRAKRLMKKAAEEEQNEEARKAIKDILMHLDMLSVEFDGLVVEILRKRTQENMKIEKKEEKQEEKATEGQIRYIKDLCSRLNIPFNEDEIRAMTKKEASAKIEELLQRRGGKRNAN
ncbi:hypothetical protein [Candidatus Methanodesulfokora washburnensis]|uniref:Uncharacterized protein n=1 Tax=Candidatus Methanodesulfokora washburnensis TaxID=2478471 RepID=A0A429GFR6_9CREN|nr:hypothetical protein [Candidatus Methanodesulfokores washburnensis]RSN72636.1 hypothetical protein D6D85_12960 [Candidatus Methanodesulfokores washburnensis]